MRKPLHPFRVMANQSDIQEYALRPGPVRLQYTLEFEQHLAREEAGLSLKEYQALPGNPVWLGEGDWWSKAHVIAWYRLKQLIPAVANDAQSRELERKMKQRGVRYGRG